MNRRLFLQATLACSTLAVTNRFSMAFSDDTKKQPYKVGICDWNLAGGAGRPHSFEIAKPLGFQGVQISYHPEGEFSLSKKENRKLFLESAKKADMEIVSLAMGILNDRPLATDPDAENWVADCIDAMEEMEVKNVLLAFFPANGDLKDKPDLQKIVIEKLKRLTARAEKAGCILSIESYLNAKEHIAIIDAVGSNALKVYYDPQNMAVMGYDVLEDIASLQKKNLISETHLKDNGHRLEDSPLDYAKIAKTFMKNHYSGWVVLEGSVTGDWKESQAANAVYAKKIFNIS